MRRVGGGLALSLLGGLALLAAFPPLGWWPLVFIGFLPVALAQHRVLPARAAGLATVVGLGPYFGAFAWQGLPPGQRWWLLLLAPVLCVTGAVDRCWQEASGFRHLWWSTPAQWTGALFLLGLSPLASWVDPAYALFRQPWLIQPVSLTGLAGLNAVILLVNYALASAVLRGALRVRVALVAGAVSVLGAWGGVSAALLGAGRSGAVVRVAAVQPGFSDAGSASGGPGLAALEADTRTAAAHGATVVVWPEKVLRGQDPASSSGELARLATQTHVHLVVGYTPDPQRYNRVVVIGPLGQVAAVYDKQHPVVFAGDHSSGGPIVTVRTPIGTIAPIICYDLDFDSTARDAARHGANLLTVPSEDWSSIAHIHYAHLVFRAVEDRLAAVKADTEWDSAIIDPEGRILRSTVSTEASNAVLIADVPLGTGHSIFVTTGNILGWCAVALTALSAWIAGRTGRRRPSDIASPVDVLDARSADATLAASRSNS